MTRAALSGAELPYWPRFLGRELAAAFVGVSPNTFDAEVRKGRWPAGLPRGERGGRLTWDRRALEMIADAELGIAEGANDYGLVRAKATARRKSNAKTA
jgi:hypothetical protein